MFLLHMDVSLPPPLSKKINKIFKNGSLQFLSKVQRVHFEWSRLLI